MNGGIILSEMLKELSFSVVFFLLNEDCIVFRLSGETYISLFLW